MDSSSARRWYQLHKSSWCILILAIAVLFAVNLPYDYERAESRIRMPAGAFMSIQGLLSGQGENEIEQRYGGWPLRYLSVRSGGYFDIPVHEWSIAALAGDLAVAAVLGALVVGAYEQRRRRRTRRWQLTLSDLCFLMLFVCGIFGTWNLIAHRYRTQENAIFQLEIDGGEATKQFILPRPIVGPEEPSPWRARFHAWLIAQLWNHERPHAARLTGLTDEVKSAMRQLREIETLVVQNPNVQDEDVAALLEPLQDLETLQIDGGKLTDACVPSLRRLKRLRTLRIRDARLSDDAIASLAELPRLISLDVEGTPLTDRGLAEIAAHQKLRELNIARTKVTGEGLQCLNGHPHLTRLWLASDAATTGSPGVKRVHLSNLPALKSLYVPSQIDSLELTNLPSLTQLPCQWEPNELWERPYFWLYNEVGFRPIWKTIPFPRPMEHAVTAKHVVIREVPSLTTLHLDCRTIASLKLDVETLQTFSTTSEMDLRRFTHSSTTPNRYDLDDSLCESIGRNKSLQSLSLVGASLSQYGWEQLASLAELNSLELSGANATEEALAGFATATKLQTLSLAETDISNDGWDKLPHLPGLQSLDLSGTQISRLELEDLPELNTLTIERMPLELLRRKGIPKLGQLAVISPRPLVAEFENLAALRVIQLHQQCVERLHIENLPELGALYLTGSSMDDSMLADLGNLPSLQSLALDDTDITDATLRRVGKFSQLAALGVENTAVTDEGLAALSPELRLTHLDLTGTNVSDVGLSHLSGQQQLNHLDLTATSVRGPGLKHLSNLTGLEILSLAETRVTSDALAHLQALPSLRWLRLSGTDIDDSAFEHLSRIENLVSLFLNSTSVTDEGIATFRMPATLKELDVSNTGVTESGARSVITRRAIKVMW